MAEASAAVAGVTVDSDDEMTCGTEAGTVDLAIALDHLSLKAAEEGIGTCWIGAFRQKQVKQLLNVPEDHHVVCLMTLGYPETPLEQGEKNRKPLEELLNRGSWS